MTKAGILFAALALLTLAAPAHAQGVGQPQQPPIRTDDEDKPPQFRVSPDAQARHFPPDYSVAHAPPQQLQPAQSPQPQYQAQQPSPAPVQFAPPVQQQVVPQTQAQTSQPATEWTPPAVTNVSAPPPSTSAQGNVPPPGTNQPAPVVQAHPRETVVVTANAAQQNGPYRLGTGDKVRVTVFGEDDLSGEFQVDGSGFVALPLIGTVRAQDLTSDQLAAAITSRLQDGYLVAPRVTVAVSTYRPFYIIGQVNKPGEYPYVNDMSALNAVALAGGYTDAANESSIYVRSPGDTDEHSEPADSTTQIHPGDIVRVPKSAFATAVQVLGPLAGIIGLSYGYANVH